MKQADYVIVGGGIGGCVLASRLHQKYPSASILLIEAGADVTNDPLVLGNAMHLPHSNLDWGYRTVPQKHLGGRVCANAAGKALGGGSAINASEFIFHFLPGAVDNMKTGAWTRGDKADYDLWGKLVGDKKWSYAGFLPYFIKTERHHNANANPAYHGLSGPVYTSSTVTADTPFPLREHVRKAWKTVAEEIEDPNSGSPLGFGPISLNRREGKRQLASSAYDLSGVEVMTETLVSRVLLENNNGKATAVAVELANGDVIRAAKEVVACCGAYRTPQLLLLSGIGSSEELVQAGIEQIVDLPEVGKNLHDHIIFRQL